jgi:integrase
MSIYPGRVKGTFRVVIWAPRATGQPSRPNEKTFVGKRREAEVFEAQWRIKLRAGLKREFRGAPTLETFCSETFAPYVKKRVADSTWKNGYSWRLAALCEHLGRKRLSEISSLDAERYQNERDAGPSMVNGEVQLLRSILKYASERHGIVTQKIEVTYLTETHGRPKAWTKEQADRIIETARSVSGWMVPLILFGLNTGCRKGEIVACEWTWVDMPGLMIRIPANEYWKPKSGRPREVPMSDALKAMFSAPMPRRHERWVFPSRDGGRFAAFPKDGFARVLEEAKMEGSPHWLRHTYASLFLSNCPDLPLLADIMGHSSTFVTEKYRHMLPGHLAKGRNAVNIGAGPAQLSPGKSGQRS